MTETASALCSNGIKQKWYYDFSTYIRSKPCEECGTLVHLDNVSKSYNSSVGGYIHRTQAGIISKKAFDDLSEAINRYKQLYSEALIYDITDQGSEASEYVYAP